VKIGEISKQTGVSQRMIRHFEAMNLLDPQRVGNYRNYSATDKQLILRIRKFQDQGLSLKEIRIVLEEADETLEVKLLESLARNRKQIQELENKNLLIWESLQSLKLSSSTELLVKEGVIMEFVKSFEEKNLVRGRMPYLEVLYETFVHLSGNHWSMKWDKLPMEILHSTDLIKVEEGINGQNINDLKVVVSSEEQQYRNAFTFFLSPELLHSIAGKEVIIEDLDNDKETNLLITKWVSSALETFNHAWNASFTTIRLENRGMLKSNDDIKELYHEDEIFILTNMYTENEKERLSVGLPYRFVSIVYNLLKR